MHVVVWRFRARAGRESEFERAYGPDGPWAALFRRAPGFIATELLRSAGASGDHLTLDRWASRADRDAFLERWAGEYAALDAQLEALTEVELPVGEFEARGPPGL